MTKHDLEQTIRDKDNAIRVVTSPEWKVVMSYLEKRFVELSTEECPDHVKWSANVAARNEIKNLIQFLGGELKERDFFIQQLRIVEQESIGDEYLHAPPYGM